MREAQFHVAVSGLIGAGKSTLVGGLAPLLGAQALPERFDRNPYLDRFYREPARWAFQSFVFFLEQSFADEVDVRNRHVSALQERVMEEHVGVFGEVFRARGYLEGSDLMLLSSLAETANGLLPPSDLLLHLDVDPTEALRRIHVRGRSDERTIELEYLEELNLQHERFVEEWSESPILRVQAEEHDFREMRHLRLLAAQVESAMEPSVSG
ncbi:MAG TPA: deoxynucleoside kinase [Solirubrobacteraceae bacterium]|nr:deoxynucleoside kinase [Solirubrobacteraceae bacterium]